MNVLRKFLEPTMLALDAILFVHNKLSEEEVYDRWKQQAALGQWLHRANNEVLTGRHVWEAWGLLCQSHTHVYQFTQLLRCVVSSEASAERSFSRQALQHTDLRSRLSAANLENEIMIAMNPSLADWTTGSKRPRTDDQTKEPPECVSQSEFDEYFKLWWNVQQFNEITVGSQVYWWSGVRNERAKVTKVDVRTLSVTAVTFGSNSTESTICVSDKDVKMWELMLQA